MTAEQLTLTGELADERERGHGPVQVLVLRAMRDWGRVEPDEAGAIAHEHAGRHGRDERCDWCTRSGRKVLASLSKRGYKNGRPGSKRAGGVDPATSAFPKGF